MTLDPYLPYLPEYVQHLELDVDGGVCCGNLCDFIENSQSIDIGCNFCKLSTSKDRCLFNADDSLYQPFQDYLSIHYPELFI